MCMEKHELHRLNVFHELPCCLLGVYKYSIISTLFKLCNHTVSFWLFFFSQFKANLCLNLINYVLMKNYVFNFS